MSAIVVTGFGVCTPFGAGKAAFSRALRHGRSGATEIGRFDTAELRSRRACCVPGDVLAGMPRHRRRLPAAYAYAATAADEALADARLEPGDLGSGRVGIFFGAPSNTQHAETFDSALLDRGPRLASPLAFENMTCMTGPGTLSIERGIKGPTTALPGGFAAGLHALHVARTALQSGRLDVALVAAGDEISALYYRSLAYLSLLSPRRHGDPELSRPFARDRDGMVLGEGGAAVVLEREPFARVRRAPAYAEVAASAVAHDGRRTFGDDGGRGIESALRLVLRRGDTAHGDVDFVAACANSSTDVDRSEAAALRRVFPPGGDVPAVSGVKSMTGETGAAGGLLNVAACLCAMRDRFVPPTINVDSERAPAGIDLVVGEARAKRVGVALANAYSLGGATGCVLLRAPSSPTARSADA